VDEQEWLSATDPRAMLEFLGGRASARKLRLFACACCRQFWHLLKSKSSRRAVDTVERYAEGSVGKEELWKAQRGTRAPRFRAALASGRAEARNDPGAYAAAELAAEAAYLVTEITYGDHLIDTRLAVWASSVALDAAEGQASQRSAQQCGWLRDFYPFRPVAVDPSWRTPTVMALAEAVYEESDPESRVLDNARLAVLADALDDAGCCDSAILNHCRGAGEHYRGCFVVDSILGRS
jgi:hypothetical protein